MERRGKMQQKTKAELRNINDRLIADRNGWVRVALDSDTQVIKLRAQAKRATIAAYALLVTLAACVYVGVI